MMIIDPIAMADVGFTRPSPKWVFDRTGALVQVPANILAVTYDPSDLAKAPYALVEPASTNMLIQSNDFRNSAWAKTGNADIGAGDELGPDGTISAQRLVEDTTNAPHEIRTPSITLQAGQVYTMSVMAKAGSRQYMRVGFSSAFGLANGYAVFDLSAGVVAVNAAPGVLTAGLRALANDYWLCWITATATATATGTNYIGLQATAAATFHQGNGGGNILLSRSQLEPLDAPSSRIPTVGATVTRAADVIASGAGLVYSNVPITEPDYNSATTYAKDAVVHDPVTHNTYVSLIAGNVGKPLTDTTSWAPNGVTNRWAMLDQYNNTQTSNPEEIIVVLTAQALAQGVYIGNADASDVRISCYDPNDGLVYQETQNLIIFDSGSSFYNWCFKRIRKKSYAVSVQLPPYYTGLVTITLRKPGGTPKCGMCVLGPLVDVGLSQYGLSREIKDYSTVNFNFDGTSNVQKRNFAKVMDVDVLIDNAYIDSVIESLEGYRQKPVAWIGSTAYGSACLFGTYTSFKSVIQYPTQSAMNLQIQGTV